MDVATLHQCFLGTLQADANTRTQAEQGLQQAEQTPGFLGACLDIVNSDDVQLPVKKACLVYFKNFVLRHWESGKCIDNAEKPVIRERLVPTIVRADRSMKNIFVPVLNEILVTDYPDDWPGFLDTTLQLLSNTHDIEALYTGMLCFSELCRKYRWMKNQDRSQTIDPIIRQYFPSLLQIGKQLASDPAASDSRYEAGEILKLIIKCYKFVTYMDLPVPLQEPDAVRDWITFHVDVMNMALPPSAMQIDEEERYQSAWVKSQKWAYANLFNLYVRFGSKGWLASTTYEQFREIFTSSVVPNLLKVYFGKIQEWRQGQRWISDASFYHMISFIEHAITRKSSWQVIQPYLGTLISELAFPMLCPRDTTLDLFENDPQEYILMTFTIEETKNSPVTAVRGMVSTLSEKRKKVALEPILQFAYEKLTSLRDDDSLEGARQKEAALRLIGAISAQLVEEDSPVKSQLESFLSALVFPNFKSQHGFLRARTCDVSSKFDRVSFQDQENLSMLFQGVMNCFNETDHLPVQFEAALTIQAFIDFPQFKEALGTIIVPTTEKLLTLSNEIDSDVIPAVIQSCVENYSEQLEPFGVNLMGKLTEQLTRILEELNEAQNANPDDFDNEELGSKTNAALGLFSTIITVLLYFENSAEKVGNLEQIYAPMLHMVLQQRLDQFFAETFEMIENTTFLTRSVSPIMWSLFQEGIQALLDTDLSLNLEDAIPALKNYMVYGGQELRQNQQFQRGIMEIIAKVFSMDGDFTADDIVNAAELSTYFLLALDATSASPYVPDLIKEALKLIGSDDPEYSSSVFKIVLMNMIIAALVIDPNSTMQTLLSQNAFDSFFQLWAQLCTKYKRVFDLKLSIMGLLSLMSIDSGSMESMKLTHYLPQAGQSLAILLSEIPRAISEMEKKRKEFTKAETFDQGLFLPAGIGGDIDDEDDDADYGAEGFGDEGDEAAYDGAAFEGDDDALDDEFLNQFGFTTGEELDEDPYANTPLDNVNVFKTFKDYIVHTQGTDPAKYGQVVSGLTPEQQGTLQNIVQIASD